MLVSEILYSPVAFFIKLTLFLLYIELFSIHRWMRICAYFGIAATAIIYSVSVIVLSVECLPRTGDGQLDWLLALDMPKCLSQDPISLITGCLSILSDFYLLILPLPAVWDLCLPTKKKIGVSAIFLTGFW